MNATALRERFDAKVLKDVASGCWLWTAFICSTGYGRLKIGGRRGRVEYAHRVAYELYRGAIPDGLQLDHLCRTRSCVNPDHLEPVTLQENLRRIPLALRRRDTSKANAAIAAKRRAQTHCLNGHPFDSANTYVYRGSRLCKACQRERVRASRARRRATP